MVKIAEIQSRSSPIWVTTGTGQSVTELNTSDGSWVRTLYGASYAFNGPLGVAFDGSHIWVTNYGSENLMKLNPANGAMVGTYTLAGHANP